MGTLPITAGVLIAASLMADLPPLFVSIILFLSSSMVVFSLFSAGGSVELSSNPFPFSSIILGVYEGALTFLLLICRHVHTQREWDERSELEVDGMVVKGSETYSSLEALAYNAISQ